MPKHISALTVIQEAFEHSLKACDVQYKARHFSAWQAHFQTPTPQLAMGQALANQLRALAAYAEAYSLRFPDSKIGHDGVLGEAWADMLRGFIGLLNGDLGHLDGGALDAAARDLFHWAGFDEEL